MFTGSTYCMSGTILSLLHKLFYLYNKSYDLLLPFF